VPPPFPLRCSAAGRGELATASSPTSRAPPSASSTAAAASASRAAARNRENALYALHCAAPLLPVHVSCCARAMTASLAHSPYLLALFVASMESSSRRQPKFTATQLKSYNRIKKTLHDSK